MDDQVAVGRFMSGQYVLSDRKKTAIAIILGIPSGYFALLH